jgi:hypothetical protein
MFSVIADLWPDDIKADDVISPEEILDHQARQLEQRTNGLLTADVVKHTAEDRVVIGFDVQSVRSGNRVRLFSAEHRVDFEYPIAMSPPAELPAFLKEEVYVPGLGDLTTAMPRFQGRCVKNPWVASSPAEFQKKVQDMLAHSSVKSAVLSLLARASRPTNKDEDQD